MSTETPPNGLEASEKASSATPILDNPAVIATADALGFRVRGRRKRRAPTAVWMALYLNARANGKRHGESAAIAGVHRHTVDAAMARDTEFAQRVESAHALYVERLEARLAKNALELGDQRAIEFALKAELPAKYNPAAKLNLGGHDGGPVSFDIGLALRDRLTALAANLGGVARQAPLGDDSTGAT